MTKLTVGRSLLFLVILLIPTQLSKHFWPMSAYVYSLPVDYLAPQIYLWDLLVVLLMCSWFYTKVKVNSRALLFFLVYFLSQLISLSRAVNFNAGLIRLEQLMVCGAFGVYLGSIDLRNNRRVIVIALEIAVLFEAVLGLVQVMMGRSIGFWILGERTFDISNTNIARFNWFGQVFLRAYGTFPHPNVLAGFMVLVIPLLVALGFKHKITLVVGSMATLASFSRAGLLVLLGELLVYFKRRIRLLFVIVLVISPLVLVRFQSAFDFDYLSLLRREELASNAWQFFVNSPLLGIGVNNFINQTANSLLISGETRFLQPVHNIFLLTLAETGIFGLLAYLMLIGVTIYKLWCRRQYPIFRTLLFCWVSLLFLGMFDHYFLTLAQGQRLFYLIWGLSWSVIVYN